MPSILEVEEYMKYTCDVCKYVCWVNVWAGPKGWTTTKEDYSNSICPDCNPYLINSKEPDPIKLQKVNEKCPI